MRKVRYQEPGTMFGARLPKANMKRAIYMALFFLYNEQIEIGVKYGYQQKTASPSRRCWLCTVG